MTGRPVITLLTDFGLQDHYVGAMKGVIMGICPDVQIVDISHEVTPYAIAEGAYTLSQAWNCFPAGTVHLVVIDPGVGSARRPILVEAGGHYFVAPDNGVLSMLYAQAPEHRVREITATQLFRQPVSRTFHGRDIFAPVAAHLAAGELAGTFGTPIRDFQKLDFAEPVPTGPNCWRGTILKVDRFGNAITNFATKDWPELTTGGFQVRVGEAVISRIAASYAEAPSGELFLIAGSADFLEISMREARAAEVIRCGAGDPIELNVGKKL